MAALRAFALVSASLVLLLTMQFTPATCVDVGAVRWDAWFGAPPGIAGIVGRTVTNDLSPERFHYRLPFFAKEHPFDPVTNSTVTIQGNTPEVMTSEINYAVEFGIDFWAFCAYPIGCKDYNPNMADCPKIQCCAANYMLSYALNQYLASPDQHKVKFALILQTTNWYPGIDHGGNETVEQEADRYVEYFKMSNHQQCCGNRPVVYIFGGVPSNALQALNVLKQKCLSVLGVSPYFISMNEDVATAQKNGFDALTRYVVQNNPKLMAGMPYATGIAQPETEMWETTKNANFKLMPSISPGWDPSPREYIDLPWGDQGHTACVIKLGHPCYIEDPTMQELSDHTEAAVKFALENPHTVESNAVIIGAWNENDEGHWVVPSLYNGTQKLQAIQKGVRAAHAKYNAKTSQHPVN